MTDQELLQHIEQLVNEEHDLMERAEQDGGLDEGERARMKALEVSLDQCWDLLRQRRARRSAGLNPNDATERDPNIVEHYQQ